MDELIKQIVTAYGVSAILSIAVIGTVGWTLKTLVLDGLKGDIERLKNEGRLELAGAKQALDIEKKQLTDLRTEFMAEAAIRRLLEVPGWELRSFNAIKRHLGGFSEDHLRRLLVRSGAIQFWSKATGPDGKRKEFWGLLSKNGYPLSKAPHQAVEVMDGDYEVEPDLGSP